MRSRINDTCRNKNMSKKRKTKKQKQTAHIRHSEELHRLHLHAEQAPTYSIPSVKREAVTVESKEEKGKEVQTFEQKDIAYLKHDMAAITAASGIIVAFDILLFVLLSSNVINLHFLGY